MYVVWRRDVYLVSCTSVLVQHQLRHCACYSYLAGEAADLARLFNEQLLGDPWGWRVNFLTCWLYRVWDPTSKETPIVEFLVEEELEGKYTKWWVSCCRDGNVAGNVGCTPCTCSQPDHCSINQVQQGLK
jgi:hypothetical protein